MKRWIFSAPIDLAVFGGTALVSLALLFFGPAAGSESPEWSWIVGVLIVDVAHVWSTAFVVYLDPAEWKRRPGLYAAVPIGCFAAGGVAISAPSETMNNPRAPAGTANIRRSWAVSQLITVDGTAGVVRIDG